jgi:DNA-binding NarL/FixJ family response regulator
VEPRPFAALAAHEADPGLAARLTRAADDARARGARRHAVALFGHALRLTSPAAAERPERVLARVGARRPRRAGELTPTERRVAELAAEGLANKQIANAMFVTVHTVEVHLARVYAKLGVRSRTQLATRLASGR